MVLGAYNMCLSIYFDEKDINDTKIIQYFIMHGLGLCIKLNSFLAHMFYAGSFVHNSTVTICIKQIRCVLSLNKYTTVFSWVTGNSKNNRTK